MTESNKLCSYYEAACALAAARCEGLILAIEDGYGYGYDHESRSASDVFLSVDAVAAHNPECAFKNEELAELLEELPFPTVGTIDPADEAYEADAETWAVRSGYARDRVVAYAECKAGALKANAIDATDERVADLRALPARVKEGLRRCEELVASSTPEERPVPALVHADKRAEWAERADEAQQPTLREARRVTGALISTIEAVDAAVDAAARDSKVGTERFISIVFPPPNHALLVAANAADGGVRVTDAARAYPAYVTVHNSKGAIESMPATAAEARPNSVIVPDAASLLCDLHSLSTRCGRDPLLLTHAIRV